MILDKQRAIVGLLNFGEIASGAATSGVAFVISIEGRLALRVSVWIIDWVLDLLLDRPKGPAFAKSWCRLYRSVR